MRARDFIKIEEKRYGVSTGFWAKNIVDRSNYLIKIAPQGDPKLFLQSKYLNDREELQNEYISSAILQKIIPNNTSPINIIYNAKEPFVHRRILGIDNQVAIAIKFLDEFQILSERRYLRGYFARLSREILEHHDGKKICNVGELISQYPLILELLRDNEARVIKDCLGEKKAPIEEILYALIDTLLDLRGDTNFRIQKTKNQSRFVRGLGSIVIGSVFVNEMDWSTENIGFFLSPVTKQIEFAKIDYGRSFRDYPCNSAIELLKYIAFKLSRYPKAIDISIIETREAIEKVSEVPFEEIKKIISEKLYELKKVGLFFKNGIRAEIVQKLQKQRKLLKDMGCILRTIEDRYSLKEDDFFQRKWMDYLREDPEIFEKLL